MTKFILLASLLLSNAWALREEVLQNQWFTKVWPFYEGMKQGTFENAQKLKVFYAYSYSSGRSKNIVFLTGQGEPSLKYAELLYDLHQLGYNVFTLDHQGQGRSGRLLDQQKNHVKKFQHYVDDVKTYIDQTVLPLTKGQDLFLLAHSMGGAVSVHYLSQNPGVFKKAFLSAPMLQINTAPYPEPVAFLYASFLVSTGKGNNYAPNRGPYVWEEDTFEDNQVTSSEVRFGIKKELYKRFPEISVGDVTARWVFEALRATAPIHSLAPSIKTPIFMTQAGRDEIVKPGTQTLFCRDTAECHLEIFPDAKHEIFMERDQIREDAVDLVDDFFSMAP